MTSARQLLVGMVTMLAAGGLAFAGAEPIRSAGSDAQGRLVVNGKPFFPVLLYGASTNRAELNMFREFGFNALVGRPDDAEWLLANGFYTVVHTAKPVEQLDGVLCGLGMDSPVLYFKEDLIGKAKADLDKVRALVPGRPVMHAIGYWLDEPGGVIANTVPPEEKYEDLVRAIDVAAPYLYPVPYQPVRSIAEAVGRAETASGGCKPLVPVLQIFTWDAKDRYPTPAELKCMVYLALMHGADGISYYCYNYVAGKANTTVAAEQPAFWQSVKGLNAQAAEIGTFLFDSEPVLDTSLSAGGPDVDFRCVKKGTAGLILLANTGDTPRTAVLRVGPGTAGPLARVGGGAEVDIQDGKAIVPLAAFEAVGLRW